MAIKINCFECGKEMIVKPSRFKMYKSFFCSYLCKKNNMIGKKISEEHKKKIGMATKKSWNNGVYGSERNRKISISKKGFKHSIESKNKIKVNHRGYQSIKTRKKISKTMKGMKKSEKHRENLSKSKRGTKLSEETKNKLSIHFLGSNSSLWKGGISFEPYDKNWTNKFRRDIRKRDNNSCFLCNFKQKDSPRLLCVHHIDYNKKSSIKENCVTLCDNCHIKTNFNRKYRIKLLQSLLSKKYNYIYDNDIGDYDEVSKMLGHSVTQTTQIYTQCRKLNLLSSINKCKELEICSISNKVA